MHVDDVLLISYSNTNNILNLAAKQKDYKIVFMNIPRQTTNIILTAVETIKDGFVSSGKYQGDSFRTDPPHVVLFSNKPLCWENLTKDKWKILHITAKQGLAGQNNTFEILTLSEYLSKKGKAQAGEEWAAQGLSPQLIKNAKKYFEWTNVMKKQKERRFAAEKKLTYFIPGNIFF
jgi:hypothetical protein